MKGTAAAGLPKQDRYYQHGDSAFHVQSTIAICAVAQKTSLWQESESNDQYKDRCNQSRRLLHIQDGHAHRALYKAAEVACC